VLASLVGGPTAALDAALQQRDQVPGFYRLKVGDRRSDGPIRWYRHVRQKILFWGDIVHALRVQLPHPEVTAIFDIDQTAAAATRNQLLSNLAREDVLVAGPHMNFPALGRLRKEGSGYSWRPVVFTDRWDEK